MNLHSLTALAAVAFAAMALTGVAQAQQCGNISTIPEGLAFDAGGNLWQADYSANATVWSMGVPPSSTWPEAQCEVAYRSAYADVAPGATRLAFFGSELAVASTSTNQVTVFPNVSASTNSWTIAGLQRPLGVAFDSSGHIFIAENAGNDVAVYAGTSKIAVRTEDASGNAFAAPGAIAIYGQNLYVGTLDGAVRSYSAQNFLANQLVCNPSPFRCSWSQSPLSLLTTFQDGISSGPTGIAFDGQGNVYISYYFSGDVVKYSSTGVPLMTISKGIAQPEGVAVSAVTGDIFVANSGSGEVTAYGPAGNYLGVFALEFVRSSPTECHNQRIAGCP